MFCETRKLAQEWSYRFLAAALAAAELDAYGAATVAGLAEASPLPPRDPTPAEIRVWAATQGIAVSPNGRVPAAVRAAFIEATRSSAG